MKSNIELRLDNGNIDFTLRREHFYIIAKIRKINFQINRADKFRSENIDKSHFF